MQTSAGARLAADVVTRRGSSQIGLIQSMHYFPRVAFHAAWSMNFASLTSRSVRPPASWVESVISTLL